MAAVKQWDDGFNTGDVKSAVVACADQTSIIDDIPPHEWHGPGGCSKWMNDAEDFFKKNEMTNVVSTLANLGTSMSRVTVPMWSFRPLLPTRRRASRLRTSLRQLRCPCRKPHPVGA